MYRVQTAIMLSTEDSRSIPSIPTMILVLEQYVSAVYNKPRAMLSTEDSFCVS